jgi:hypothetical protein
VTNNIIVSEFAIPAATIGNENLNLMFRTNTTIKITAVKLRMQAILKGFQVTSFMNKPAMLQRNAVNTMSMTPEYS